MSTTFQSKLYSVRAQQWFKWGDNKHVSGLPYSYFHLRPHHKCRECGERMDEHGYIPGNPVGHPVCPGDYVVAMPDGRLVPFKPSVFEVIFETAKE